MIAIARAFVVTCLVGLIGNALAGPFAYVTHQKISVIDIADNSFVKEIEVPLVTRFQNGAASAWIADVKTGAWLSLAGAPAVEGIPGWSPDGQRIAFGAGGEIYVVDWNGGKLQKVSPSGQTHDANPAWAP